MAAGKPRITQILPPWISSLQPVSALISVKTYIMCSVTRIRVMYILLNEVVAGGEGGRKGREKDLWQQRG